VADWTLSDAIVATTRGLRPAPRGRRQPRRRSTRRVRERSRHRAGDHVENRRRAVRAQAKGRTGDL